MNSAEFRKELEKVMPGYTWTIHKSGNPEVYLSATGIQSSGFNRLSTLMIERREKPLEIAVYEVKSAGFGKKAKWLARAEGETLARALRSLQSHCEGVAQTYGSHARYLQEARAKKA
jgi:hypothetical protein